MMENMSFNSVDSIPLQKDCRRIKICGRYVLQLWR